MRSLLLFLGVAITSAQTNEDASCPTSHISPKQQCIASGTGPGEDCTEFPALSGWNEFASFGSNVATLVESTAYNTVVSGYWRIYPDSIPLKDVVDDCALVCYKSHEQSPSTHAPYFNIAFLTPKCTCRQASASQEIKSDIDNKWGAFKISCTPPPPCSSHTDGASCCEQEGCAFSNSDCIDAANLNGNSDSCVPCAKDEYVSNGACTTCPTNKIRDAGDNPLEGNTVCVDPPSFKPANKNALKTAVDECLGSSISPAGDCCATSDGVISKATEGVCSQDSVHLSDWDTSLITDMDGIFEQKSSFDQDVGRWDVSSVTTIWDMFWAASSFTNKGQPLYWDVRNVKSAAAVFGRTKFNQCLCNWDTSNIQDMRSMFNGNTEFNQDVSCFDMTSVYADDDPNWNNGIGSMFSGATGMAGRTVNFDISRLSSGNWNSGVTGLTADTSHSFSACTVPPLGGDSSAEDASGESTKVACASHQDQSSCCAQYGCSFSNNDCIDTSALYGNTDQCTVPCAENQHVVNHVCTACPAGKSKPAGDRPGTNSDCWDAGSCGGVQCVNANTESCTNDACVCKTGFGGTACDKDTTPAGFQKMLKESRKKALPSREDLLERQKTIKSFARDTLKQKIKQGKSVKDAIKETKVAIEPSDLPQRSQMIVQLLNKAPVVAVAPANRYEEDTCAQGVDTAGCSMVDLSEDSDELTILSTDPEPGSWSVLSSGGAITSKQTRISEFVYEMQCWDDGWGEKETLDVTDGAQLYACNGNVIMIASQSGICTPTTCNNGNCTVDGTSYVCSCEAGWTGEHCDEVATNSQCYEFDCSNYGGHKTLEHCGNSCSASACCNYATKAAFDAVCDALTTSVDYVDNKCCHRDICI